jgi:hypothetical protein
MRGRRGMMMNEAPHSIKVTYEPVGSTGLISAVSNDLKGFRILGKSLDELHHEGPIVARALVQEMFGVDCTYHWTGEKGSRLAKEPAFAELVCN